MLTKLPKILILSHGETEFNLMNFIITEYFYYRFLEEELSTEFEFQENPRVIPFLNNEKVQSNEVAEQLIKKIDDELFITSNFVKEEIENSNLYLIISIDFAEKKLNNKAGEIELLNNAKEIAETALSKVDLSKYFDSDNDCLYMSKSLSDVKVIFFEKAIEHHFCKVSNNEIMMSQNKKPKRMARFLSRLELSGIDDLRNFIGEIGSDKYNNNLFEIIDFLDTIFQDVINFLKS